MALRFSVRAELAAAIRRVNVAYSALSDDHRPKVCWDAADDALEAALKAPSHRRALDAIREWERHSFSIFEEVAR
jgi:hypothetical protein